MKKLNFETIKKINSILILIIAVAIIISFSVQTIKKIIPRKQPKTAQIKIVDSNNEKEVAEIKESIDFYKKIDDVYIFSVSSSAIQSEELIMSESLNLEVSNAIGQSMRSSQQLINFIFEKNGDEKSLFTSKVFIYKHQLKNSQSVQIDPPVSAYPYGINDHDFNIYAVIKNDTNNDKTLDSKDNISLYISDYDGNNLQEISSSIYYFGCTDKNIFVFSEYNNGEVRFFEYDGNLKKVKIIKTFKKELTEKRINLWY